MRPPGERLLGKLEQDDCGCTRLTGPVVVFLAIDVAAGARLLALKTPAFASRHLTVSFGVLFVGADPFLLPGDLGRLIKDVAKEPVRVWTRNRKLGSPSVIRTLLSA